MRALFQVCVSMVSKEVGRCQAFEHLLCGSVVRHLDEWRLAATWVKVLDVPFEDAVRFEYDGPTPPEPTVSEVAAQQLAAAKANAQAKFDAGADEDAATQAQPRATVQAAKDAAAK